MYENDSTNIFSCRSVLAGKYLRHLTFGLTKDDLHFLIHPEADAVDGERQVPEKSYPPFYKDQQFSIS